MSDDILAELTGLPPNILMLTAIKEGGSRGARQAAITQLLEPLLWPALQVGKITNALRVAHFLGQAAEESWQFSQLVEEASGSAYEGRKDLGNVNKGDGVLFKGRGIFQLTGRANYRIFGQRLNLDFEGHPDLAADPGNSLRTAVEYWTLHALNVSADNDDCEQITRRINGGTLGLAERQAGVNKALSVLGWN